MAQGQIVQHALFDVTETLFTFAVEKLANRTPQALLDDMVRVDKGQAQAPAQLAANRRFTRAWKAYKNDTQGKTSNR
jgi:hypothetical protein